VIIDFHTHARPGDGNIDDFLRAMDQNSIDMAVIHAVGVDAQSLAEVNDYVHQVVRAHPDRLIGFASVMPCEPDAPELLQRYVEDYGFQGLKLHPSMQNFSPIDPRLIPVMLKCIELDVPALFHTGPIFAQKAITAYGDPLLLDQLAISLPEAKIIMAHGDPLGPDPAIAAKHPHVYIDTAIVFGRLARLIPGVGEELLEWMRTDEKVLFGTDANPGKTWRFAYSMEPILKMDVPEESRAKILGGTAAKLLKLAA
jgi:predicted TIM-barrel fold metal-dependent hydrolase